jgi:hypothetical protein
MVETVQLKRWLCPICHVSHESRSWANECQKEHLLEAMDEPREHWLEQYECEMCKKQYDLEQTAGKCEQHHIGKHDKFYVKFSIEKNFRNLEKAAMLGGQQKLMAVV